MRRVAAAHAGGLCAWAERPHRLHRVCRRSATWA